MSIIVASNLFLIREFTTYDSSLVSRILGTLCDDVKETRKGRVWEVYLKTPDVGLTIRVQKTDGNLPELEDDLIELGLLPDNAPDCISIVTSRGTEMDLKSCQMLTESITDGLECLTLGARFHS